MLTYMPVAVTGRKEHRMITRLLLPPIAGAVTRTGNDGASTDGYAQGVELND
jgi:hypothetical protein